MSDYEATFKMIDADGDGYLSVDELGGLMKALGQETGLTRLVEVMVEADLSRDGKLNLEEFTALMSR
ncbi:MAG: EF-hand domain-containing protein [Streptosporangiaceae bacterium]